MRKATPLVSVVMPVHNGRPFLDESISSIVKQSLADFEFIILDDASTDDSGSVARQWEKRDSRIRLFRSDRKLGLAGSSNFVVLKANTNVLARMDADDISLPDRLRRQWEVMERRPDVVAVGTLFDGIDAKGRTVRPRDRWRLVRRSPYIPFAHGSAMFRKEAFDAIGGYCEDFAGGEDQDFFFKLTTIGRVVTLPNVLYRYRYHSANATQLNSAEGVRVVAGRTSRNGEDLAALYLRGAMRLWAGERPGILREIVAHKSLKCDLQSLLALASASLAGISPEALRFLLRSLIHTRDLVASFHIKDGRTYEWRSE